MYKLKNLITLSCKRATELIDKKSIVKLSITETVQMHMHTAICDGCAQYKKQSIILDKLLRKHIHIKNENDVPQIENKSLKQLIISKL